MLNRKSQDSCYPAAIVVALVISVTVVMASLTEAVFGMQTFL